MKSLSMIWITIQLKSNIETLINFNSSHNNSNQLILTSNRLSLRCKTWTKLSIKWTLDRQIILQVKYTMWIANSSSSNNISLLLSRVNSKHLFQMICSEILGQVYSSNRILNSIHKINSISKIMFSLVVKAVSIMMHLQWISLLIN